MTFAKSKFYGIYFLCYSTVSEYILSFLNGLVRKSYITNYKERKMKKQFLRVGTVLALLVAITGCSSMQLTNAKIAGQTYYVSVQQVKKHSKPDAASSVNGVVKMGDTVTVKNVVPLQGHLLADKADNWVELSDGSFIPGNTVISETLWDAQRNGLPPRGGVKVKNFTSAKHQESDGDLDMASVERRQLLLMLGANGVTTSADAAYPNALTKYIKVQNSANTVAVKLAAAKRSLLDFPPLASFAEIGPYQEFDMGAGLAAHMMKNALSPKHPITVYVTKIVDRLLKNSTLPYAYSGYTVLVINDDKTVNACAAPGGFIIVTTGMIKYLQSEEELALILAHEVGHLEFHHSVRELTPVDYAQFALNALMAGIDLNDPIVKRAIKAEAERAVKAIPFIEKLPAKEVDARISAMVDTTTNQLQKHIEEAKSAINTLLTGLSDSLKKGYSVEFEAAADRRAVSLAAAAGYNADALLSTLGRIKKDYNGFGEAYPVNRDELVAAFKADYAPKSKASAIGNYSAIKAKAAKISKKDLFIQK